jgi:predicted dehydrogenase
MKTIRWGILGLGSIAKAFVTGLRAVPDAQVVAVGSRSLDKAQAFVAQLGASHSVTAHGSYAALAADPAVDVIYIATPHPMHLADAVLCMQAGKAVLCEKPIAVNAQQVEQMIAVAQQHKVFLMEAMWTRFLPIMVQVRTWLQQGAIGQPRQVAADFGFRGPWEPQGRLLNPSYAGGALLDVGIYPISFAAMVFGAHPNYIAGTAHIGSTGVDEQSAISLGYANGGQAALRCAIQTETPQQARIDGTSGSIILHDQFWKATTATLKTNERSETITLPHLGNGYEYEAMEVGRCLRSGLLESPTMTWAESLALMRILDTLRKQWGLRYPMEQ